MSWEERALGEFMRLKHGYAFKSEHFAEEGDHVLLTPGNFFEAGGFKLKNGKEKYYTGDIPDVFILKSGDLLVAMTEQAEGLLGSLALIPSDDRYLHNQRLGLVVDLDESQLDRQFLYHLFNTREVRSQISASASGIKVRHTSPDRIYRVKFLRPPIQVQRKIAFTLSAYDELIKNNERRIALLDESSQLLYKEWFQLLRFPGHEHSHTKEGLVDGWAVKLLREVAVINRKTLNGSFRGEIDYIDISSVTPGSINETTRYEFEAAPGRARRVVKHGDIIWSCVRPNRRSHAVIWRPPSNLIASTGFAVISPQQLPSVYLYFATTTDSFVGYLSNRARGAAYPAITGRDFEEAGIVTAAEDKDKIFDISRIDFDKLREEFARSARKNTTVQSLKDQVEKRLARMLAQNPLRTDFNRRYQEVIADYNREKDRGTIEETFSELLEFVLGLSEEEMRASREGLDEETLALFDLLLKPELSTRDRNRLKDVARDLLNKLKEDGLRVDQWREKEATKAEVRTLIRNFLWDEGTGLPPESYQEAEVEEKADAVFAHIFRQYADATHHVYTG